MSRASGGWVRGAAAAGLQLLRSPRAELPHSPPCTHTQPSPPLLPPPPPRVAGTWPCTPPSPTSSPALTTCSSSCGTGIRAGPAPPSLRGTHTTSCRWVGVEVWGAGPQGFEGGGGPQCHAPLGARSPPRALAHHLVPSFFFRPHPLPGGVQPQGHQHLCLGLAGPHDQGAHSDCRQRVKGRHPRICVGGQAVARSPARAPPPHSLCGAPPKHPTPTHTPRTPPSGVVAGLPCAQFHSGGAREGRQLCGLLLWW